MPLDNRTRSRLVGAGAVLFAESLIEFLTIPTSALSVATLAVALCIAALLVRGSRIAWFVVLSFAVTQLLAPFLLDESVLIAVVGAILLLLLVSPSVVHDIWTDRSWDRPDSLRLSISRGYGRCIDLIYDTAARLPGLGSDLEDEAAARAPKLRNVGVALALWIFVAFPAVGALNNLRHGSARGDTAVDLLWHICWIGWNLIAVLLVVLLIVSYKRRQYEHEGSK